MCYIDPKHYYSWFEKGYDLGSGRKGWICPKCGAVLAPWMSLCPFCAPKSSKTEKASTKSLIKINEEVQDEQEEG